MKPVLMRTLSVAGAITILIVIVLSPCIQKNNPELTIRESALELVSVGVPVPQAVPYPTSQPLLEASVLQQSSLLPTGIINKSLKSKTLKPKKSKAVLPIHQSQVNEKTVEEVVTPDGNIANEFEEEFDISTPIGFRYEIYPNVDSSQTEEGVQ
jgi:hypothetical protein